MLDAINRYDQRMKHAIAGGHTEKMKSARKQMREVVSIKQLQDAEWWPADTALIEYAYGGSEVRSTNYEVRNGGSREKGRGKRKCRNVEMEGAGKSRSRRVGTAHQPEGQGPKPEARGPKPEARSLKPEARPANHEPRTTNHGPPVYLWLVKKDGASFHRLGVSGGELDRLCSMLSGALTGGAAGTAGRGAGRYENTAGGDAGRYRDEDDWVEPAAKLYEHTIRPIADRLRGIEKLVIVGDGKLRTVPFEVFISSENADENRYIKHRLLIEDYAVSYAPSATTLEAISTKTQHADVQYTDALWAFASTTFGSAHVEPKGAGAGRKGQQGTGKREQGTGGRGRRVGTAHQRHGEKSKNQNVEMKGSRSRGAEETIGALHPKPDARNLKPDARPANHEPQITNHDSRAFAISCVTPDRSGSTTCRTPDGK